MRNIPDWMDAKCMQFPTHVCFYTLQFHSINPEYSSRVETIESKVRMLLKEVGSAAGVSSSLEDDSSCSLEDVLAYASTIQDALFGSIDRHMSDAMYIQTTRKDVVRTSGAATTGFVSFMTSSGVEKPQLGFVDIIDNSNTPFVPKYDSLKDVEGVDVDVFRKKYTEAIGRGEKPPHPLEDVLGRLVELYRDEQLVPPDDPQKPGTIEKTELRYIDTVDELKELAEMLDGEVEIAVDLEAHDYHSFQGFCCLMQLSTRTIDVLVDVLKLRNVIGRYLGGMFANPKVVKVLHGSRGDLVWLQRDFGIYTCNLFDTGVASKVLNYKSNALAYLLEKHCGFKADKRWQLADWRIRPLQNEAIHYARADTHWLLYCYDVLRIELSKIETNQDVPRKACPGILRVLEESKEMCCMLYEKELFSESSYYDVYQRMENKYGILTERQLSVFAALYKWRDTLARELDESPGYILPKGQLFQLAVKSPTSKSEFEQALRSKSQILMNRRDTILYLIDTAMKETSTVVVNDNIKRPTGERVSLDVQEAAGVASSQGVNLNPNNLYSNLNIETNPSVIRVRGASTLGSMRKQPLRRKQTTNYTPLPAVAVTTIEAKAPPSPEPSPINVEATVEKAVEDISATKDLDALPVGTLDDDDFLPLPISKLKHKRPHTGKDNNNINESRRKKILGSSSPNPEEELEKPPKKQSTFDPEKALSKYSFAKKERGRGRGRGRGGGRQSRKEEDYSIPTGMFNPLSGLLEGKSSSKRSATQVRSGNRSSTYRKR